MSKKNNSQVKPRRMQFEYPRPLKADWFAGNLFVTQFFTAFLAAVPLGERFMVRAVREFREPLKQFPAVYQDAQGFIGQEAHHANSHDVFNQLVADTGQPMEKILNRSQNILDWLEQTLSPRQRLAVIAGLEHFTAMFGEMVLANPEILDACDAQLRPLFVWHGWEEIEHKDVTFDVYQTMGGRYDERVAFYIIGTSLLSGVTLMALADALRSNRAALRPGTVTAGLNWMFGFGRNAGYFRRALPTWAAYFRRDFHPGQLNTRPLLAKWQQELDGLLKDFQWAA